MSNNIFREIEHGADLAIEIKAESVEKLFLLAAEGFYALVLEPIKENEIDDVLTLTLEGRRIEDVLVSFLNEINYYLMIKHLAFKSFTRIHIGHTDGECKLICFGEICRINKHKIKNEIKAATYHQLKVIFVNNICTARIIFDT